jgi:hypothetical protein
MSYRSDVIIAVKKKEVKTLTHILKALYESL